MLNLNDKKTRNYMILLALATCVLNREYVITNYTYIIKNSIMKISRKGKSINEIMLGVNMLLM